MAEEEKIVEFNGLIPGQKWQYLKYYWSMASKFYGHKDQLVVPNDEVKKRVKAFKQKPLPKIRRILALKDWRWKLDSELQGVKRGYFKHRHADKSWKKTILPHNTNYTPSNPVEFGTVDYPLYNAPPSHDKPTKIHLGEYAIWYRTSASLRKEELQGKRAFLKFESCSIKTTVWVDEWPVILEHYGVYPFEMEITEELLKSKNNDKRIVLEVKSTPSNTPDFFYNCNEYAYVEKEWESQPLNWGGISGAAELVLTSPTYLKDLFMYTKSIDGSNATLHVRLEIENTTKQLFNGVLQLDIKKWYPEEERGEQRYSFDVKANPLGTTVVEQDIEIKDAALWRVWEPNLYLAHATLSESGASCDDVYETFGVRTFTAKDGRFYLNGEPIVLAATHDQGMYPDTSPTCPSDYWIVQDILLHKALGMVAARYPSDNRVHYRRIAEYADQMGLMLIWEGYCSLWLQHPDIEDLARRDVPRMIRDLRNHPSIVVWVPGDEPYLRSIYQNKRLHYFQLMHELVTENDPSRLMMPAGDWTSDLLDVIESYMSEGLKLEEARKKALELLPVYASSNVYWDVHRLPSGVDNQPVHAMLERFEKHLCGAGWPMAFDEFGAEGMPNWKLAKGEWWYKRWTMTPMLPDAKRFLEPAVIGRRLSVDDWQVSQAYQASVNWRVLSYIRESGAFAGFSNCHVRDVLNYYNGLVDSRGRGKLAFFLFRNVLSQFFISAMHGNYVFKREGNLSITVSNNGHELRDGKLTVRVMNEKGRTVEEKALAGLTLGHGLTQASSYKIGHLPSGLYAVEYNLRDGDGKEVGSSLDIFFIE